MAQNNAKGYQLEELLRAYFLRSGMYVVRGVPLQFEGDDLTDIDLWLYERPTGSSRRRQIVDIKSKLKPKAIERLFWTKGLFDLLKVDDAYVATTDNRPKLKDISTQLGISVIDGTDLDRISESEKVWFPNRLNEEDFLLKIKSIDRSRKNKILQSNYFDLKSALIDNFGASTVNRSLDHFSNFSSFFLASHPNSPAAEICLRLIYFSASIVAIALDYSLSKIAFKSIDYRRKTLFNIIRYGNEDQNKGLQKIRLALALVKQYSPNGGAISQSIENAIKEDYEKIPAEIISDYILTHLKNENLFKLAKSLEFEAFKTSLIGFDSLPIEEKAFLGILMDFIYIDREKFANKWHTNSAFVQQGTIIDENVFPKTESLFK